MNAFLLVYFLAADVVDGYCVVRTAGEIYFDCGGRIEGVGVVLV